jgi:uncharacterized protein (DUF2252 family)
MAATKEPTASPAEGSAFQGRGRDRGPPQDRAARGRSLRSNAPRSSHAGYDPGADRSDPVAILEEQAAQRLPELVPIRYGRMSVSPFSFFRGAAAIMASDLALTAVSGIPVQLCGDAHLANFGVFASAERQLLFDLNDFDETLPGPWEWDVKRLATSIVIAGRELGFSRKHRDAIARDAASEYRQAMHQFAGMGNMTIWYARVSGDDLADVVRTRGTERQVRELERSFAKARRKDNARAFAKLAVNENGRARIRADPPLLVPIEDLVRDEDARQLNLAARHVINSYLSSLAGDRQQLLSRYRYADLARKVVGIGSVGTRCWVVLLLGRDTSDPLFLQVKEAQRSVLEPAAARSRFSNQGRRVVEGQRLMQAPSDIFLGWLRAPRDLIESEPRDFYVRQLWDAKASADIQTMRRVDMAAYARACAWTLARAHARSGDAIAIGGYVGSSDVFDRAITTFAEAYADQNERDYSVLLDAIASGRIEAQTGV